MRNWQDLPTEILDIVFRNLKQNDIGQCSLVCTTWRFTAQRVLFKNLKLSTYSNTNRLKEAFPTASFDSQYHQSLGNFVRSLKFVVFEGGFDIALLDRLFPFLEYLSLCGQTNFYKRNMYELLKEGRFRNLMKTPFTKLNNAHLQLILARREKLKELELRHLSVNSIMLDFLEELPLLPRLEVLQLQFSSRDVVIFLETLLSKDIPTMKSISIEFGPKIRFKTTDNTNQILPLRNIKEVKISFREFFFDDDAFLYFMSKFPDLKVMNISKTRRKNFKIDAQKAPSKESITKFLIYLFNIRYSSSTPPLITNESTPDVLKNFFDYAFKQNTFKRVEIRLKIDFEIFIPGNGLGFSNNRIACIIPKINYINNKKVCKVKVVYRNVLENMLHYYLELIRRLGNMNIESLKIGNNDWIGILHKKVPLHLDTILAHMTNLKKLVIYRSERITFTDLQINPVLALEYLELQNCTLKETIFPNISQKCVNLKVLKIVYCDFEDNVNRIDMPSTRLCEFWMDFNCIYFPSKEAIIKLETANNEFKYYKFSLNDAFNSEKDPEFQSQQYKRVNYEEWLKNENRVVYELHFEAVTKLIFKV